MHITFYKQQKLHSHRWHLVFFFFSLFSNDISLFRNSFLWLLFSKKKCAISNIALYSHNVFPSSSLILIAKLSPIMFLTYIFSPFLCTARISIAPLYFLSLAVRLDMLLHSRTLNRYYTSFSIWCTSEPLFLCHGKFVAMWWDDNKPISLLIHQIKKSSHFTSSLEWETNFGWLRHWGCICLYFYMFTTLANQGLISLK